jgi:hypothetical protein
VEWWSPLEQVLDADLLRALCCFFVKIVLKGALFSYFYSNTCLNKSRSLRSLGQISPVFAFTICVTEGELATEEKVFLLSTIISFSKNMTRSKIGLSSLGTISKQGRTISSETFAKAKWKEVFSLCVCVSPTSSTASTLQFKLVIFGASFGTYVIVAGTTAQSRSICCAPADVPTRPVVGVSCTSIWSASWLLSMSNWYISSRLICLSVCKIRHMKCVHLLLMRNRNSQCCSLKCFGWANTR